MREEVRQCMAENLKEFEIKIRSDLDSMVQGLLSSKLKLGGESESEEDLISKQIRRYRYNLIEIQIYQNLRSEFIFLSAYLSDCLSLSTFACPSFCLSVYPSSCLFHCLLLPSNISPPFLTLLSLLSPLPPTSFP